MVAKIKVALYDSDGYMTSLVRYLCRKCQNFMEARLFTDPGMLKNHLENRNVDVLLVSEDFKENTLIYAEQIPQIIFFSEHNDVRENAGFPVVFKYQSVSEIVKEILTVVAENDKISYSASIISKRTVEIIGGYAPFGGGGVTRFLYDTAEKMAKKEKVLYVNLEEFHGLSHIKKGKQGNMGEAYRGMSEVLFYLRQKKGKLALKLESIVYRKGNLDSILAVEDYRDLHAVTKEDMMELLQVLLEQTSYQTIVFDIGFLCDATLYLMEECRKIYMPEPQNEIQISKEHAFSKNLKAEKKEELLEKRVWIKD